MPLLRLAVAAVVAYLIGSIPVGYLVIRVTQGKDIRTVGSGRTGGTNAMRAGGSWAGIATGAGDILKGFLAVIIARLIVGDAVADNAVAEIVGGVAAVIGHNYSVFMGFRGGAGTTPNVGGAIAIWPLSALWLLPLLPIGLNMIRYASLMSLLFAAIIPISFAIRAALGYGPWLDVLYGVLTGLIVAWSLRPNIKRLINGTEPRSPKVLRH
jgi:acyl phosphate:glycerol-3-phosphate acyltransferase